MPVTTTLADAHGWRGGDGRVAVALAGMPAATPAPPPPRTPPPPPPLQVHTPLTTHAAAADMVAADLPTVVTWRLTRQSLSL